MGPGRGRGVPGSGIVPSSGHSTYSQTQHIVEVTSEAPGADKGQIEFWGPEALTVWRALAEK